MHEDEETAPTKEEEQEQEQPMEVFTPNFEKRNTGIRSSQDCVIKESIA